MKIQIEKGVAIPTKSSRKSKYPFRDMEVGDSFFIKDTIDPEGTRKKVSSAATMFCHENDYKFKTQVFPAGVRIWRIK